MSATTRMIDASGFVDGMLAERERCSKLLELTNGELLLMCGEMTSKELRLIQTVLKNRVSTIMAKSS